LWFSNLTRCFQCEPNNAGVREGESEKETADVPCGRVCPSFTELNATRKGGERFGRQTPESGRRPKDLSIKPHGSGARQNDRRRRWVRDLSRFRRPLT